VRRDVCEAQSLGRLGLAEHFAVCRQAVRDGRLDGVLMSAVAVLWTVTPV
jgi:hypothetical protein